MIERLCGPVPRRLIRKIPEDLGVVKSLFDRDGTLRWPELAQVRPSSCLTRDDCLAVSIVFD